MSEINHTPGPVETLARLAAQSGRYNSDPDLRDAVNDVLGVPVYDAAPDMLEALKQAKREMWVIARHSWTLADFKNWAVIQQIDAALTKADGQPRSASPENRP